MPKGEEHTLCEAVRECCFELLFPELAGDVPHDVRLHAASCKACTERLGDVRQLLGVLGGARLQQHLYTRQLTRHFRLLGAKVGCNEVKQFLPLLADEQLDLKIPTPVTIHCDQCPQCGHDLNTVRSLNLRGEQLARLSALFSHEYRNEPGACEKYANSLKTLAGLRFDNMEADAARHVCACRKCRNALYEERLRLKLQSAGGEMSRLPCGEIKSADMFDFVVPFGLDPQRHQYIKFNTALAEHLRHCPNCLERMRQMHNIIYAIDARDESSFATVYQFVPGKEKKGFADISESYKGWPIKVQAAGPGIQSVTHPRLKSRLAGFLSHTTTHIKFQQFAKIAAAAAVFIILGTLLFTKMPQAEGVMLSDVYSAFSAVNVHVRQISGIDGRVIDDSWVSARHQLLFRNQSGRFTLWDLKSRTSTLRSTRNGPVHQIQLSEEAFKNTERAIKNYENIMPFSNERSIPAGYSWEQIDDPAVRSIPGTVIYDLTWTTQKQQNRWRAYIHVRTNLLQRSEFYTTDEREPAMRLTNVVVYDYPSDENLMAAIEKVTEKPESGAAGIPPSIPALSP
jgi:hypothetical protein